MKIIANISSGIQKKAGIIYCILSSFLLLSCVAYKEVGTAKVNEAIKVTGTKDQLFLKSNEWAIRTFTNPQSAIQYSDKSDGKIIGKYLMYTANDAYYLSDVYSVITITVEDKNVKIEIEPLPWKFSRVSMYAGIYKPETAQKDIKKLIDSFKGYMVSHPSNTESLVSR